MRILTLILALMTCAASAWCQSSWVEAYSEGLDLMKAHEYNRAIENFERAYAAAPPYSQERSRAVWGKGMAFYAQAQHLNMDQDYQGAYTKYAEAMKCFSAISRDEYVMDCAYAMGSLNFSHFDYYNLALQQYEQAYGIAERLNLPEKQIDILSDIIEAKTKLHRHDEAALCATRLDSLLAYCLPPEAALARLIQQGENARNNRNYDVAISFYTKAMEFAAVETDELRLLQKLRNAYNEKKDYANALIYSQRCVDAWQTVFEDDPKEKLLIYRNHYPIQLKAGDIEGAFVSLDSIKRALDYGGTLLEQGQYYVDRGLTYANLNEWSKAAECYGIADSLLLQSEKTPAVNEYLRFVVPLCAAALYRSDDLERSYDMFVHNLSIVSDAYGEKSMEYADALCYLANIEGFLDRLEEGMAHYIQAWETARDIAAVDLELLPSNARGGYWDDISSMMWNMVPYAVAAGGNENEFTAAAFDALMFCKGLLLSLEKSTGKQIQANNDERLLADFMALANLRNEIEKQRSACNGEEIMRLYEQMDALDRQLAVGMNSAGISPVVDMKSAADILAALGDKDVLIDFADFVKEDGTHVYASFILKHGMKAPHVIKVFDQSALDSLLFENGGKYSDLYLDYNQEEMYRLLWLPMQHYLDGADTVYLVPSGILHQIAMEAVRLPSGEYADDKYSFVRLSSSRELLRHKSPDARGAYASARLYGGLEYDVDPADMALAAQQTSLAPAHATRGGTDSLKASKGFEKLKESGPEVIEIERYLSQSGIQVDKFMESFGTEESFVDMSGNSPDILHISTHGFYYSPEGVPAWSSLNGYDNPMYLTGLVLSGGNGEYLKRDIPDGVMGGLLTSSDIACLDLSATRLVVLSACETGLGETTNEGVYGLQRAFKKAGAGTLVMSLWSVSDEATKMFMTTFHRALAADGGNKRDAFRIAKAAVRDKYDNPYYWAPFVMID